MSALGATFEKQTSPRAFIDALLAEERQWTAVERFSNWHDRNDKLPDHPSYRGLIPLAQPNPGQQYAFEVDLDQCSGCKACVTACHSLNGLDDTETWRSVGLLVGSPSVQQHVTTACHHCVDPGCLNGCPVLAYEKDPMTGIVRHLDDQCIGCQYCIMKCPYEVPQYSDRLGIVRKCDMCYHRLAVGEAPACAQACPSKAIRITIVDQAPIRHAFRPATNPDDSTLASEPPVSRSETLPPNAASITRSSFLPDSPDASLTVPTTQFLSQSRSFAGLKAADHSALRLQHPHWPLVFMLLFTQAATGLFIAASFCLRNTNTSPLTLTAAALLGVGLITATLHLGRPLKAWRAFLGWRKSWLSRELIALNAFAAFVLLTLASRNIPAFYNVLILCDAALGLLSVFASAMVYVDTGRPVWNARITFGSFFGTTLGLGAAFSSWLLLATRQSGSAIPLLAAAFGVQFILFLRRRVHLRAVSDPGNTLHLNARVVRELLPRLERGDIALFIGSIVATMVVVLNLGDNRLLWLGLAAGAMFGSELIARYLFFVSSAAKRMPGGVLA